MTERHEYDTAVGTNMFWRVFCAIFGHDPYRAKGWYFIEFGCHRCKMKFKHRWDMFETTSTHDIGDRT